MSFSYVQTHGTDMLKRRSSVCTVAVLILPYSVVNLHGRRCPRRKSALEYSAFLPTAWNSSAAIDGTALATCRKRLDELAVLSTKDDANFSGDPIGLLLQIVGILSQHTRQDSRKPRTTAHRAMAAALKLFEEDLAAEWTLTRLAKRVHPEPSFLFEFFMPQLVFPQSLHLSTTP